MSNQTPTKYYFKKYSPKVKIFTPQGAPIQMEIIDNIGYFFTEDQSLAGGIQKMISQQRGGMEEITEQQYNDRAKKNSNWRPSNSRYIETRQTSGKITDPRILAQQRAAVMPVAATEIVHHPKEPVKPQYPQVSPPISPRVGRKISGVSSA